ncbi:MAG: hypothetical protein E7505_02090 [Ruminococcus sp.]|nr:hypothetical protein [Ruminococcus sp.]
MTQINVINGTLSKKEQEAYLKFAMEKYPNRAIRTMQIDLDGDYVNLSYEFEDVSFQRIRRITGYLVGELGRFNNAKRSEVEERVVHGVN